MTEVKEASAAGENLPAQRDSRAQTFDFEQDNARNSVSSSEINFADLPPGVWETRLHGSCPECHHYHVSVPLKISHNPGIYNGVRCRKCGHKWFGLGGGSAHASLVSQETLPRSLTLRSVAAAESGPVCSDAPSMSAIMSLANSMRSMSAIGSPPLATAPGSGIPPPVAARDRSHSHSSAFRHQSGVAPPSLSASRQTSRLLSPIDCTARGQQSVSAPQSPLFGPQQLQQSPVDATPLNRQRSLKDRFRGGFNKMVGKLGYEIRKIERSKSVPPRGCETRNGQQPEGSTLQKPQVVIPERAAQLSPPPLVTDSPIALITTDADEEAPVDYRRTPSGHSPSALEIEFKRKELTAKANRKCQCSKDCHCQKLCSPDIPGFTLSSVAAQYSGNTTSTNTTPTRDDPQVARSRSSFEVGHMSHEEDYNIPRFTEGCLCPDPHEEDQRLSTADTLCSASTMSLTSGDPDPGDPNLHDLMHSMRRIFPQDEQLRLLTDFDDVPAGVHYNGDSDRTPTNVIDIDHQHQSLANQSEIDSTAAALGGSSIRSSCSEPCFIFRRESFASVASVASVG